MHVITTVHFKRRFNFQKADQKKLTAKLEDGIWKCSSVPSNYGKFSMLVSRVFKITILRGCRERYTAGLNLISATLLKGIKKKLRNINLQKILLILQIAWW